MNLISGTSSIYEDGSTRGRLHSLPLLICLPILVQFPSLIRFPPLFPALHSPPRSVPKFNYGPGESGGRAGRRGGLLRRLDPPASVTRPAYIVENYDVVHVLSVSDRSWASQCQTRVRTSCRNNQLRYPWHKPRYHFVSVSWPVMQDRPRPTRRTQCHVSHRRSSAFQTATVAIEEPHKLIDACTACSLHV